MVFKLKPFIFIIFIVLLSQFLSKTEINDIEPEQISINYSSSFELNSQNSFNRYYVVNYSGDDIKDKNYLIISSLSNNFNKPGFIYISFSEKNPSADNRQYLSQNLGKNEIIINTSKLQGNSKLYINIHSLQETEIKFDISTQEKIYININDLNNNKKKFKISDVSSINMLLNKENINYNKLMFYSTGEDFTFFSMKIQYQDLNSNTIKEYTSLQKFENGYGAIININELNTNGNFEIIITPNEKVPGIDSKEKEVEVGVELTEENDNNIREINIMEHIFGYILDKENCYRIKNLEEKKDMTLLLNTFTQAMSFIIYNTSKEKQYSLDIFDNYYIKINSDQLINNNYFCFKKFTRKEKETEELGEISYDMQIYYDDDLTQVQPYFYPLINGKIYTYSIKQGQIMLFRHSSYTKYNFLYSAVMNSLRGKPVLYGYTCDTYPECNLDIDKFNQIKNTEIIDSIQNINNYYINKKSYAVNEQEKNGEKMNEARKQYLSLVVCESSEDLPNKGECQFSIEIDNYLNEIQLIPDKVYANSILFDKNYFRIKLSDYNNLSNIKIYFTSLTGNADLYIYSDPEHKNLINNYNYRHVHRKEIFEFNNKENTLLENYYIIITSKNSAFIEIKYETDFHYKGYAMTNPNEINIEYVNKKDYYTAYEMLNPNYFYPINNPKNNDYYFTVHSLDCGLIYRYDFYDNYNITSMHKEIPKTSEKFGTSYGLMLKVDNYFHTTKDESEDCAVMIYTGEKNNQDIPLLITEDMFHPSEFKDTYYIYPFIINDDFDGIVIQFKFDMESLLLLDKKPEVNIVLKLPNQLNDFEQYTINSDSSFFLSKKKISKYCTNILYQCSLRIDINKVETDSFNYKILTNVHSSYNSVEYIYKNTQYNYNLRSKDKKYFYTQIDSQEQGQINFIFNKGNGKVYAKIVEKNTIEQNPNFNRRVNLPESDSENLLPYDPLNNVIKYDTKNYNNCNQGCELYFLIESNEKTEEKNYLMEVSFSIDKKYNDEENGTIEINNMNKYLKGTLTKNENEYKYYTITIPYEYQKISINLYSLYGKAYVKQGKHHFCKKDNYEWELIPDNNGFGRLILDAKDNLIQKDSLKNISLSIGITYNNQNKEVNEKDLFYYIEIQGLYNDDKKFFYHITNERSIICDTGEESYCNAILYINSKYNNKRSLIYALPEQGLASFYANIITKSDLDKKSYSDSISNLFPTKENSQQKSENKNHIFIKLNNKDDVYILLTIYSNKKNDKIKLISNGLDATKTLLPYGTEKVFDFYQNIKFHLPYDTNNVNNNDFILNIKSIKGMQNIELKDESTISNIDGNYYIKTESYLSGKSFEIENIYNSNIDQGFVINLLLNKKNNNLFKLDKNIKNEISLSSSGNNVDTSFPQNTYIELNTPIKIEIYFHDINYDRNSLTKTNDTFKINAKILNSKNEVVYDNIVGDYLLYEKTGIIKILQDKIKTDDKYYLYNTVDKDTENKNNYNKIMIQYVVNDLQEMEIIPNKFYYSSMNNNNDNDIYLINKKEENDKYIVIDFSENIPVINSFDIKNELLLNNNMIKEDSIIKEIDFHGRKRFIIDLNSNDNYKGIKFNVRKNSSDNNIKYYTLNYYSVKNLSEIDDYKRFNDTLFIQNNKDKKDSSNLIFNTMMRYKRFFTVKDITYYIDIFEKKDEIQSLSNIYSTYIGNDETKKNVFKSLILNSGNINFFSPNVTVNLDIKKEDLLNKKYLIRLLADINNNDGTREKFVYNGNLVDLDNKGSVIDGTSAIIICSVYIGVVSIVVLLVAFICVKLNKNTKRDTIKFLDDNGEKGETENEDVLMP